MFATSYHFCWQFWWAWVSQRNMSVINLVDLSLWSVLGTHVIGRAKKKQINQIRAVILEGDKELSYFRSVRGDLGVSKNRGTTKSSISIGLSIINHPFWGTPIFGNTHIIDIMFLPPFSNPPKVSPDIVYFLWEYLWVLLIKSKRFPTYIWNIA